MADRYWVGGTATWDATAGTKWATTSGGAGGQAVPTTTDDVYFDANSGAVTVTVSGTRNSLNLNFTGFTGTFAGTGVVNIFSNLTLASGMTMTYTGDFEFEATTTGKTVTTNGCVVAGDFEFQGVGGGWTLQDALTTTGISSGGEVVHTAGTLDLNGQELDVRRFSCTGTTTRTLTMGDSVVEVRSASTGASDGWVVSGSNLTLNEDTSTIRFTSTTTAAFNGGSETYYNIEATPKTVVFYARGSFTCNDLTVTGGAGDVRTLLSFVGGATPTITGTLSIDGNSATNRISVFSSTLGTPVVITAAAVSLSNADFEDITGAGAATWSGTSLGDAQGNSNITFPAPTTRYWVGNGGSWSDSSHWAATSGGSSGEAAPLCHDDVVFDSNSFSTTGQTVTLDVDYLGKDITFSVGANAPTVAFSSLAGVTSIFGDLVLESNVHSSIRTLFRGRSAATLEVNNATFSGGQFYVSTTEGNSLTLVGDIDTGGGLFELDNGILDLNDYDVNVDALQMYINDVVSEFRLGNGTHTVTDYLDFEEFGAGGYEPLSAEGSTVILTGDTFSDVWTYSDTTMTFRFNRIIVVGGVTREFDQLNSTTTLHINDLISQGSLGANTLRFDQTAPTTIVSFSVYGTETKEIINSLAAANAADLTITNAKIYNASIQDINSINPITVYDSTNVSGNTNITFSTARFVPTPKTPFSAFHKTRHATSATNTTKNATTFTNVTKS